MLEEAVQILILSAKCHAKAAGGIQFFAQYFDFCLKPFLLEVQNWYQIQNLLA